MKKLLIILALLFFSISYSQNQWVIYKTNNSGLPDNSIGTVLIDSTNTKWITTNNGFVRLKGNTWTVYDTTNSGMPANHCSVVAKDKQNRLWITSSPKGIVRYDGTNWMVYNTENTGYPINQTSTFYIDNSDTKWIGYPGGLLKYNDTTWVRYHTGNSGIPSNTILSIYDKENTLWVGTYDAGVGRFDGQNWTVYNTGNSGLPSNRIYKIDSDNDGNIWFATQFGGVAKFNYPQNQWTIFNSTNSGLPSNNTLSIYIDNNNVKWIGTDGLAIYNDTNWQTFSYSFIGNPINFTKDRYNNMWICTPGGGLFVYNPAGVVGVENNTTVINGNYLLVQNYPNPFNPQTKIEVTIPEKSFVKINIYDINGRFIKQITKGNYNKGTYLFDFNGGNLASGIYFYRIQSGDFVQVKKMMLVK
jgi:hypothetical protein